MVRQHRAKALARVKARELSFAELLQLADSDAVLAKIRTVSALQRLPGVGAATAAKIMAAAGIAQNRTLKGLTARQRRALIDELP